MARLLRAHAVGRRITAVERLDARLPDCEDLAGVPIVGASRRAKILILDLGAEALLLTDESLRKLGVAEGHIMPLLTLLSVHAQRR